MKASVSNEEILRRLDLIDRRLDMEEDIRAIQDLKYRYCRFNDGGWDGQGPSHMGPFEELFVEDSVWDGRPHFPRIEGLPAILEFFHGNRVIPFAIHYAANPLIKIDGSIGQGHWHMIARVTLPGDDARWVLANHIDEYVRTLSGWKYKSISTEVARTWVDPDDGTSMLKSI